MATPVVDFASAVRELLAEVKPSGLDFDDAWDRTMKLVSPAEGGWGDRRNGRGRPPDAPSPLDFLRQVMKSAYEGS